MTKVNIHPFNKIASFISFRKSGIVCLKLAILFLLAGCAGKQPDSVMSGTFAKIFPDYYNLTIPPNIAPLNFIIKEAGSKFRVEISAEQGKPVVISQKSAGIEIPVNAWHRLLTGNAGKSLKIDIWSYNQSQWKKYNTIQHQIASDTIDSYLVYRLVYASYLKWKDMGIYQRNLSNFNESPLIENSSTDNGCMNCHSFSKNNPEKMLIHFRITHPGTLIWNDGKLIKTDTKTAETMSAGVYPAWHPDGKHIAFSTGKISPHLTTRSSKPVDVADKASGLMVYDTENNKITTSPEISTNRRESMPEWSADGKYLYFTSAPPALKGNNESLLHSRYSLMRIAYDTETDTWGKAEMVLDADTIGMSISMPAASPDGKFMVCAMSQYGYFTIFDQKSDLYLINLKNHAYKKMELNSNTAESHASWSLNGRWLVFSSKRTDGVFTRPYISYVDSSGIAKTPFLLPQKDPSMYDRLMANFNRPDLVTGKVELSPIEIRNLVMGEAQKVEEEK